MTPALRARLVHGTLGALSLLAVDPGARGAIIRKVGPGGMCFFFCPISLCCIPQIQPITLALCP